MRLALFVKLFLASAVISLLAFALINDATIMFLIKGLALGIALSIAVTMFYPNIRGIQRGDSISVVANSMIPTMFGKSGVALTTGKLNSEVRIRLDDGREAVGVIESYEGFLSLPRVRIVYEEKLVE